MAIGSLGIGSGLDLSALVRQLVTAERQPAENRLLRREANLQAQLSAFGTVKSGLSGLSSALDALKTLQVGRTVSSSDSTRLTATVSQSADLGSYSIQVNALARAQSLASEFRFDSADAEVGTGTLTLQVGDGSSVDIVIDEDNNSLRGVRDAINQSGAGVQASIVNDGTGARLVLTSSSTGASNTISVTVSDEDGDDADLAGLSRLASNNLEQVVAAADAEVIINGLTVTSASNTLDNAVEGLTLNLRGTTQEGVPLTVTVGENRASVRNAVNAFIEAYNGVVDQVRELTKYDPETQRGAVLVGDGTLRSIRSRLSEGLLQAGGLEGSELTNLVNLGIRSDRNGKLSLDSSALDAAMNRDMEGVVALLNDVSGGLKERVEGFSQTGGLLDNRSEGLRTRIRDIDRQREVLELRMEKFEARLVRQFSAMDAMVGQLQNTSRYLDQQLGALNAMLNQSRTRNR
ncbi:flagellar filament capping protein FliD [Thioalkalivibrio sulfidiphilus]|uniref:flagellar filament capping protein FliD n=1 Tax=Thioalkalivibrio sulfidiphilus TaxID=1033854 RepID=UPI000367A63C|nr:flagellar filament capping protein FliD [Thioalkalivibrio sulfidiphilus]